MNCQQAQQALRADVDFVKTAPQGKLLEHLGECDSCRAQAEQQRLQALLQTLPLAPPSEGFADRALAHAWQQSQSSHGAAKSTSRRWPLAAAASFLVAVVGAGLLFSQLPGPAKEQPTVADATEATRLEEAAGVQGTPEADAALAGAVAHSQVNVLLASGAHYPQATITLRLDDNLSLQGYPGRRVLQWQTAIAAGNNQLTLPFAINRNTTGGTVTLEIESDGVRKAATFTVAAEHVLAAQTIAAHLRPFSAEEV